MAAATATDYDPDIATEEAPLMASRLALAALAAPTVSVALPAAPPDPGGAANPQAPGREVPDARVVFAPR